MFVRVQPETRGNGIGTSWLDEDVAFDLSLGRKKDEIPIYVWVGEVSAVCDLYWYEERSNTGDKDILTSMLSLVCHCVATADLLRTMVMQRNNSTSTLLPTISKTTHNTLCAEEHPRPFVFDILN